MSDPCQPDPARCPLCQRGNGCAMAAGAADATTCWCAAVPLDAAALANVPAACGAKACLCAECARGKPDAPPT